METGLPIPTIGTSQEEMDEEFWKDLGMMLDQLPPSDSEPLIPLVQARMFLFILILFIKSFSCHMLNQIIFFLILLAYCVYYTRSI